MNLLGRAVFRGLRDPAVLMLPVRPDVTAIALYNGLHLLLSLAIGVTVTGLIAQAERRPSRAAAVLFTIIAGFVLTIFAVGYLTASMRPVLPWWSIVVANTLSVLLAGWYLLSRQFPGHQRGHAAAGGPGRHPRGRVGRRNHLRPRAASSWIPAWPRFSASGSSTAVVKPPSVPGRSVVLASSSCRGVSCAARGASARRVSPAGYATSVCRPS